jgi:hypothetical protein
VSDGDGIIQRIGRFEDGFDEGSQPWLGRGLGLAVRIGLAAVVVALAKLVTASWALLAMFAMAFWRRQRLAMQFEAAHRRLGSDDPAERQRALVDMMVNARRGQAEHARIARDLCDYLRRPPRPAPDEVGRRQIAFTMLTDQTLAPRAKRGVNLSGAVLAGIHGVGAELPGAHLNGADLTGARLGGANLEGADLRGAQLEGTDLTGARLAGAFLPGG